MHSVQVPASEEVPCMNNSDLLMRRVTVAFKFINEVSWEDAV